MFIGKELFKAFLTAYLPCPEKGKPAVKYDLQGKITLHIGKVWQFCSKKEPSAQELVEEK